MRLKDYASLAATLLLAGAINSCSLNRFTSRPLKPKGLDVLIEEVSKNPDKSYSIQPFYLTKAFTLPESTITAAGDSLYFRPNLHVYLSLFIDEKTRKPSQLDIVVLESEGIYKPKKDILLEIRDINADGFSRSKIDGDKDRLYDDRRNYLESGDRVNGLKADDIYRESIEIIAKAIRSK